MKSALVSSALIALSLTFVGCGTCQQVKAHREAFQAEMAREASSDAPHIRLRIPDAVVNGWTDKALGQLPDVPFDLPGLGQLSRYVESTGLSPRRMRVALDRDSAARVNLDLDVKIGSRRLFGLGMAATSPVQFDKAKGRLSFSIRADMFEKIQPKLDDGAADQLTNALLSPVPAALRGALRGTARTVARQGVEYLTRQAYSLLRSRVLTPLGEVARFSVAMPDVPLQALALTSETGQWVVDARLPFPVRGLGAPAKASGMQMAVSTEALAALGNWAMGKGHIPARYSSEGKAVDNGQFEAGFGWQSGARPLKVHMWTAEVPQTGICIHARAGADPSIALDKGKLKVGFENGTLEEITGPPLLSNAMDLMGISTEAFAFTKTIATNTKIRLGKSEVGVQVENISLDGSALRIGLALPDQPGS